MQGDRQRFDVGQINGERFAVMAGAGLDALMIRDADGKLKDRLGRAAYVLTGAKNIAAGRITTQVRIDGDKWFDGKASCVLVGNVGKVLRQYRRFPRRASRRWPARDWHRHRQGPMAMVTDAREDRGRQRSELAIRGDGTRSEVRRSILEAGSLRARRRGSEEDAASLIKVRPEAVTVCVPVVPQ